jgi:hypothetical protein
MCLSEESKTKIQEILVQTPQFLYLITKIRAYNKE